MLGGLGGITCPPAGAAPPDSGGRSCECPPCGPPVVGPPIAGDMEREDDEPVGEGVGLRPPGVTERGSFFCVPSSIGASLVAGVEAGGGVGPGL